MSQAQNDAAGNEPGAGRCGETVIMQPFNLGQAVNGDLASVALSRLDAASDMLEQSPCDDGDGATVNLDVQPIATEADSAEPSIEEYMAALIARSRQPNADQLPTVQMTASVAPDVARVEARPQEAELREAWSQSSPPECRDAISELRELANISARSSFNVHRGQQLVYEMHGKLIVALVALAVSFALTSLAGSRQSPTFYAAIVALITALAWSLKYFQLGRQLSALCLKQRPDED